jgi:hypothetical protein
MNFVALLHGTFWHAQVPDGARHQLRILGRVRNFCARINRQLIDYQQKPEQKNFPGKIAQLSPTTHVTCQL